jgi:hypothetical protein
MKPALRGPVWLLALTCVASAGCQSSVRELPSGGVTDAPMQRVPEKARAYSGVYQTFVKNYDGRLGGAAVTIQISPNTSCGSYVIVKPTAAKPRFRLPYYEAPVTLTRYKAGNKTSSFSATAKLGGDLGTLSLNGELGPKQLGILYKNARGRGRIVAYYTGKCKARLPGSGAPPDPSAFVGSWLVDLDLASNWVYGIPRAPGQSITMVISSASQGSDPGSITFSGSITTNLYYLTEEASAYSAAPYPITGTWANGAWSVTAVGNAGAYQIGTNNWYPPSSDLSGGNWQMGDSFGALGSGGVYCVGTGSFC